MTKVYHVFHSEEWVGTFHQATFSTPEKAGEYIDKCPRDRRNMEIVEEELDTGTPDD